MNCETCKEKRQQGEPVPYIVFETECARHERREKRLIAVIMLLIAIVAGMFVYEASWVDEYSETYTSEADDGGTAIVNRDGEVNYGESILYPEADKNP